MGDDELMADVGKITIAGKSYPCAEGDVLILDELGEGQYGSVKRVRLKANVKLELAVKVMRDNIKPDERKNLVREINTIRLAQECPSIVSYYGLNFCEGDVWIYMELMEISLDKLYEEIGEENIPEDILAQFTVSIFKGLRYLKNELRIMHRDVKPSNTLKGFDGQFKLADFGISNNLENSLLHTAVACSPYLSPERIDPTGAGTVSYGVESDVWSFGLTIVELAKKKYPYDSVEDDKNIFSLLQAIVVGDPPTMPVRYSADFQDFVAQCLIKKRENRPRYSQKPIDDSTGEALENHPFFVRIKDCVDAPAVRDWYAKFSPPE
jgi:serine/threonine protein kinase